MTAMAMQMPAMPPPGSSSPAPRPGPASSPANRTTQASAVPSSAGASGLSLALPTAPQQAGGGGSTPRAAASLAPAGQAFANGAESLYRVKLSDMVPEDGAPSSVYTRAVEHLSVSLAKYNAAIIELGGEDAALVRCALDSAKLYFRSRGQGGEGTQGWTSSDVSKSTGYIATASQFMYCYRAGRSAVSEGADPPPPCMPEAFKCLGKASRVCLSAIARYFSLRSDIFCPLLDDSPLSPGEISHSVLTAASHHPAASSVKSNNSADATFTGKGVEKGLLRLIASDTAGLQVCDCNGRWYLADSGLGPGDLVLLAGRALHQATAGLRRSTPFRVVPATSSFSSVPPATAGRISMTFRLVPRDSATIDCSPLSEAGHVVREGFSPVSVRQFMDGLKAAEALMGNGPDKCIDPGKPGPELSLRHVLSDPLTGALLEDAMVAHCGHSFGGGTLRRVYETMTCVSCGAGVEVNSLIPNLALQAAARAFRREERERQLQAGVIRGVKRKKEIGDVGDARARRPNKGGGQVSMLPSQEPSSSPPEKESTPRAAKGVQYPFAVNERVMIKGNKRTPGKYVGREAVVTNKCLNGWYLVTMVDDSESVRLQYRSLAKTASQLKNGVSEDQEGSPES